MTSKRSRLARSPSETEVGLHTHIPVPMWETQAQNPTVDPTLTTENGAEQEKQPPQSILSFGLPTLDPAECRQPAFGTVLQTCLMCRRNLTEDDTVYMYGYLGSYCSLECREYQMNLDRIRQQRRHSESERLKREGNLPRKDDDPMKGFGL